MALGSSMNRRRHERFKLAPMYTEVTTQCVVGERILRLSGHAYELSESGVRIELDEPIEIGTGLALHLRLAGGECDVSASANVVWLNDEEDDPGPRRMALEFDRFLSEQDHVRLCTYLGHSIGSRAA